MSIIIESNMMHCNQIKLKNKALLVFFYLFISFLLNCSFNTVRFSSNNNFFFDFKNKIFFFFV